MSKLKEHLESRLKSAKIQRLPREEGDSIGVLKIDLSLDIKVSILMTEGLSEYRMDVPKDYAEKEEFKDRYYTEIYFCLPDYWDINDKENPNMQWPLVKLQKLAKNFIEQKTWYGAGHSISNGNPAESISETMKQKHFLMMDPILLKHQLSPIEIDGKEIFFLGIVPIFRKEFARKNKKGYQKWRKKFIDHRGNEMLDDFRRSIHKRYWARYY